MSHLVNDELEENLYEMFIEAGYTEEEAEKAVLEALNARGLIENKGSNKVINHPLNKTNYKHTNQESMNNDIQMIYNV